MTEGLPRMNIRKMYFDERDSHRRQRIAERDAGVCVSGRIDDDGAYSLLARSVNALDQRSFMVALEALEIDVGPFGQARKRQIYVRQRHMTVVFGLTGTQQVQIGAMHHQYAGLFSRHGFGFSLRHRCKFAANRSNLSSLFPDQGAQRVGTDALTRSSVTLLHDHPFQLWRENHQIGLGRIGLHDQKRFGTLVARVGMLEFDAVIEQEDLDFLGAVREQENVDARMLASRSIEDGAGKVRRVIGKQFQQTQRAQAHGPNQFRMPLFLIETAVSPQFRLDLGIVRIRGMLWETQLARGLAFGVMIIGNAVLGHQAGGGTGYAGTGAVARTGPFMTGHGKSDQGRIALILTGPSDMHIHILGICGTFMGGVAQLAVASGHKVTGCDANVYPPMSDQLRAAGVDLIEGFDAGQRTMQPDIFVIGNAISRGNPLLEAILDDGLPHVSGPQWLAEHILQGRWVLGVAGTHGKTTTASMLAWILEEAGLQPGFLIGGVPMNFGVSARLGGTPFFVIEADEYDTAFCDKRSKFVHYRPRTAVLNNLEFDHADIFDDLAAIEIQFHHLVRTLPGNGLIVSNAGEASLERVLKRGCWTPVERFNDPSGYRVSGDDASGELVLHFGQGALGRIIWPLSGEHNRANACAALLAARHVGVPLDQGLQALSRFVNVKRRMEVRGTVRDVTVYDDFAHHPTAIATTIAGLRRKVGGARIIAVLEPRSNTMKLGIMKSQLPDSLAESDAVFCYAANLGWDAREALAPMAAKAVVDDDLDRLVRTIVAGARPGDHGLVMSNGGFGGIHGKLLAALAG